MAKLTILDSTGDTTMTWDPVDELSTEEVRVKFDEMMSTNAVWAFKIDETGRGKELIKKFDPQATEIVVSPRGVGG